MHNRSHDQLLYVREYNEPSLSAYKTTEEKTTEIGERDTQNAG